MKKCKLSIVFQLIDQISNVYTNMSGYNIMVVTQRLFWSSNDYENIFRNQCVMILMVAKSIPIKRIHFSFKRRKSYCKKFSENNNFYILTIVKKTEIL